MTAYHLHQGDAIDWLRGLPPDSIPSDRDRCMRGQSPVIVDDIVRVPLFDGRYTTIDLADYNLAKHRRWSANVHGYAQTTGGELLHISIMGRLSGYVIDHINRDRLDNTRANLRFVTRAENVVNASKPKTNTSGFKGVTWDSVRGKWRAQVFFRGRNVCLGRFESAHEAAVAYDTKARELHGHCLATNRDIGALGDAP